MDRADEAIVLVGEVRGARGGRAARARRVPAGRAEVGVALLKGAAEEKRLASTGPPPPCLRPTRRPRAPRGPRREIEGDPAELVPSLAVASTRRTRRRGLAVLDAASGRGAEARAAATSAGEAGGEAGNPLITGSGPGKKCAWHRPAEEGGLQAVLDPLVGEVPGRRSRRRGRSRRRCRSRGRAPRRWPTRAGRRPSRRARSRRTRTPCRTRRSPGKAPPSRRR